MPDPTPTEQAPPPDLKGAEGGHVEPDQVELVEEGSPVDAVVVVLPGKNSAEAEEQIQPGSEGDVTEMPEKTGSAPETVVE